jgi:hypothetical protein
MEFGIGVICKKLCNKFDFLEYLHRMILLRGVNEFIANCLHFMSDWGEILAGDLQFRQYVLREGRTFVMGVSASTCTRAPWHVRHSDSLRARSRTVTFAAVVYPKVSRRLQPSIQWAPRALPRV